MVPTRKLPKIAYFWPGLPQLWLRGSWAGLAIAVGFTALVNVLMLATLVFRDWIPLEQLLGGYGAVAVGWLAGWWQYRRRSLDGVAESEQPATAVLRDATAAEVGQTSEPREQLYREAQQEYLRGDWVAAEQVLLKLLKLEKRDAEARLMLATLWRHQGRHREAMRQLDTLSRLETADRWHHEIAVERQENAAALADEDEVTSQQNVTTPEPAEPETHNIADAQTPATENKQTDQRRAA